VKFFSTSLRVYVRNDRMLASVESCFQIKRCGLTAISSLLVDATARADGSSSFLADDIFCLRSSSLSLCVSPFLLHGFIMFYAKKEIPRVRHKLHDVTLLLTITKETNTAKNIVFGTSTKWF
jgi:hypothetical protein